MMKFLKENFGWIRDIGIVLFLILVMWANSNYVSIKKFENYQKANDLAHNAINTTLVSVDKTLALMQQNQTLLVENQRDIKDVALRVVDIEKEMVLFKAMDIETRLKEKTSKLVEIDSRLKALEKVTFK